MVIPERGRWDGLIVFGLFIACMFFMLIFFYGIIAGTFIIPEKKAEIKHLQSRVDIWHSRADELEEAIRSYETAMKFENLFFLVADPNAVMNFEHLETYLKNHKSFYDLTNNKPEKEDQSCQHH